MLIMTRQATIRPGKLKEALPFVAEATDRVSGLLDGQEVAAYIVPFGAPTGTVVYSTSHESLAHQTEAMSRLVQDAGYLDLVERAGGLFLPGTRDMLREIIHHTAEAEFGAPFVSFLTATVSPGRLPQAFEWGGEILDYYANASGLPGVLCHDMFGRFGQLTWMVSSPDAAGLDTARAKLQGDPGYMQRLARAAEDKLLVPGSGRGSLAQRIH